MLLRVLICTEDGDTAKRLRGLLRPEPDIFVETIRSSRQPLWGRLAQYAGDLILVSRALVPRPAPQSVAMIRDVPGAPRLAVLSAQQDSDDDARLVAAGAVAHLDLSLDDDLLSQALEGILARVRQERSDELFLEREIDTPRLSDFVTTSATMQAFMAVVERVVDSDSTLLITGETGVGKERLARAIHETSPRAKGPFVAVNCGALPESLLESELFGHARGSFTGATTTRRGWFELAHRGTIFLDEIGEMPLHLQSRLLRVLQDREVTPVGAERSIAIDVRVMSATNRELRELVTAKTFREDLYYRLGVVTLEVPPLRQRREDIRGLVARYTRYLQGRMATTVQHFSDAALYAMEQYAWPGNIRELVNVVERSMLLSRGNTVNLNDLPVWLNGSEQTLPFRETASAATVGSQAAAELATRSFAEARREVVDAFEKEYFTELLRISGGRIGEAAKRSGMTTRNLFDKLKKHDLDKNQFKY